MSVSTYVKALKELHIDLKQFTPDPFYYNTLVRVLQTYDTNRLFDMIRWSKRGIEIWRQEEGCFHSRKISGTYELSWGQLQKLYETNEDVHFGVLRMPKDNLGKLLKLKEVKYEKLKDAKAINELLKA